MEIISNPTWYNNNKNEKQAIIHEMVYGITRKVNNFWLIDTEKNGYKGTISNTNINSSKELQRQGVLSTN